VIIFFSFIIVLICGVEIGDAFSGTISSLGNVGPGIGTIGTMGNYSGLSSIVKFIFTIDMFIGRLEIFPILIIMSMIFKRQK
jgi:trk system potassium uptake protein TrkH